MRRPVLTLLGISCLTFFLGLGRQAISDSDEGFYAEAAREMVESGDWLTPHFNYEDRWQKPVLYYWLTAATYLASGPTEWAARLWSALSGLGLVFLTWAIAKASFDRDDLAWLAGAITATSYGYFAMARMALPDLPVTFFIAATIWAGAAGRLGVAGAAAGLGFLAKGPIAVVIPAMVLLPVWYRAGTFARLRARDVAAGIACFVLLGLPWYAAMWMQHGVPYLQSFFVGDNFERFATDRFNDPRPFWFYVPIVLGGLLPWSAFLFLGTGTVRDVLLRRRRLGDAEWMLTIWAVVPFLFFSLSVGKQPRYVLPMLPPLAIFVARAIVNGIRAASDGTGRSREIAAATWATALLFGVMAFTLFRADPIFVYPSPAATLLAVVALAAAAAGLALIASTRRWRDVPVVMTASAIALLLAVQFGALAGVRPEPVEEMAALIQAQRQDEPVGQHRSFVRNLGFYTRNRTVTLTDQASVLDFVRSAPRALLVVREDDLPAVEHAAGRQLVRLGQVRYLDTASLRLGSLVQPSPAQELTTVLLVATR